MRPRSLLLLPLAAFLFVATVVLWRNQVSGLQAYGMGAQYIEHGSRLGVLLAWREFDGASLRFVVEADGGYPPLLHLVTLLLGGLIGHSIAAAAGSMLLWVAVLAISTGSIARSLTGRADAAALAATLVLLLPAVPAVATRYYYDLPMTAALYGGLALQLGLAHSRPRLGVPLAALAYAAAALIKWSAVPFALLALLAGALDARGRSRAWVIGALAAAVIGGFLWGAEDAGSFRQMAGSLLPSEDQSRPLGGPLATLIGEPYASVVLRPLRQVQGWTLPFLLWFPLSAVTAVASPLGTLLLLPLAGLGWTRAPAARWPALVIMVGGVLFLAAWIHVQDERLLLTLAPFGATLSGIGLATLRGRRVVTALVVLGLAAVTLDFHFGGPPALTRSHELLAVRYRGIRVVARGGGLASSQDGIGWRRRDEQTDDRARHREAVWRAVRAQAPTSVGTVPGAPLFGPHGDGSWLRWRNLAAHLIDGDSLLSLSEARGGPEDPELLLVRAPSPGEPSSAPSAWAWQTVATVPSDDGGPAVALLRRR